MDELFVFHSFVEVRPEVDSIALVLRDVIDKSRAMWVLLAEFKTF